MTERNLKSTGNYYCGVGTVTKFDWKIQENGIYAGDIEILSPGASPFLETTQGTPNSTDSIPVNKIKNTLELQSLAKRILEDENARNDLSEEETEQLKSALVTATSIKETLQANSVAFNLAIKNLDKVADYFLEQPGEEKREAGYTPAEEVVDYDTAFGDYQKGNLNKKYETEEYVQYVQYKYNENGEGNGIIKIDVPRSRRETRRGKFRNANADNLIPKDYLKNRYFTNWGWFEDNILKTFFEATSENEIIQTVDSRKTKKTLVSGPSGPYGTATKGDVVVGTDEEVFETTLITNKCNSTDYLYSMGLDSVVLPGKHNPIQESGFEQITNSITQKLIKKYYPLEQRINLDRIRLIYKAIDENFPKFEVQKNKSGIIRNMVFPIEMYQKHFQNTPSLRQGLRNFWADVTNQYGGYWGFELGQDGDNQSHIGVFDSYYDNVKPIDIKKKSTKDELEGIFEFSVFSNESIVKSFDVNLDLSAEAATLARYGGFTKARTGTTRIDGKKELGLEAWNILTSKIDEIEVKTLEDLKRFREIRQEGLKDLKYNTENPEKSSNFMINEELKKQLLEDDLKVITKLETRQTRFVQGIGCYDNRGNFSTYFKQTMLHLINYSDLKGSGSLIERSSPLLPVSISMTLDGISGLAVGNLFKVDYLPELYRRPYIYFQITKVEHKITTAGWDTDIEAVMKADMSEFWETSGRKLSPGLENYIELFKITNIPELDEETQELLFKAFAQGTEVEFDELKIYNNLKKEIENRINQIVNPREEDAVRPGVNPRFAYDRLRTLYKKIVPVYNELLDFFNTIERTSKAIELKKDFETVETAALDVINDSQYWTINKKLEESKKPKPDNPYRPKINSIQSESDDFAGDLVVDQSDPTDKDFVGPRYSESGGSSGGGSSNRGGFNFGSSKGDAIMSQDY